jgi:hypothetical protein
VEIPVLSRSRNRRSTVAVVGWCLGAYVVLAVGYHLLVEPMVAAPRNVVAAPRNVAPILPSVRATPVGFTTSAAAPPAPSKRTSSDQSEAAVPPAPPKPASPDQSDRQPPDPIEVTKQVSLAVPASEPVENVPVVAKPKKERKAREAHRARRQERPARRYFATFRPSFGYRSSFGYRGSGPAMY